MYNVYVERKPLEGYDYWALVIEGNGVFITKTFKVKAPANPRLAYIEYLTKAAQYVKHLIEYGNLKDDKVCFVTDHALYVKYFAHLQSYGYSGTKPPKEYFEAMWGLYTTLETLSAYSFEYHDWATKAKKFASPVYYTDTSAIRAIDAFADL